MNLKRITIIIMTGLFIYLSLYTWNIRTRHLDTLAENTGLDAIRLVLKPGRWLTTQIMTFWHRYIYLIGLQEKNAQLQIQLNELCMERNSLRELAMSAVRLEKLLDFTPPQKWERIGARVIARRMGPNALLETLILDKGSRQKVAVDQPVITPQGVLGQVLRTGFTASTILLLNDANFRIPVIGQQYRSSGVLAGQGSGRKLELKYVSLNAYIEPGEILVTSGLAGTFPKGLPVARVLQIERSGLSLFLNITAEPLVDFETLEEVLLLRRIDEESQAFPKRD